MNLVFEYEYECPDDEFGAMWSIFPAGMNIHKHNLPTYQSIIFSGYLS